ncbi:MAG TPA: hypothetical protein V6C58_04645 [Allocoleopsis sp.]
MAHTQTPISHLLLSRLEHAIVANRHRLYALYESGQLDRAEDVRLELDYLNLSYWKYHHAPQTKQSNERESLNDDKRAIATDNRSINDKTAETNYSRGNGGFSSYHAQKPQSTSSPDCNLNERGQEK